MEVVVKAVGTKPLLLHNVALANPFNPTYRKLQEMRGTPAKRRTEQWEQEKAYLEFVGAFYDIPEIDGIAIPCENMRQSIKKAAQATRDGPKVQRGLAVTVAAAPLIHSGPNTPKELWDAGQYITRMIRSSSGTASPTTYPIFEKWAIRVPFELDESQLDLRAFNEFAIRAGRIEGLGASRKQGYGRFDALIETS
jgi:hypothetical protein